MCCMVLRSQEIPKMMQAITNNRKDSRFFDPSCIRISLLTNALSAWASQWVWETLSGRRIDSLKSVICRGILYWHGPVLTTNCGLHAAVSTSKLIEAYTRQTPRLQLQPPNRNCLPIWGIRAPLMKENLQDTGIQLQGLVAYNPNVFRA